MRLVVGITGATGAIYGIRLLEILRGYQEVETHLVVSAPGKRTIAEETDWAVGDVEALASLTLGVAALIAFVRRQRTLTHPLLDVGLFRDRRFSVSARILRASSSSASPGKRSVRRYISLIWLTRGKSLLTRAM